MRRAIAALAGPMDSPPWATRMEHGIDQFFCERSRTRRRISAIAVLVGGVMLLGLCAFQLPLVRHALELRRIVRFGYAGPTRYVRLLQVEAEPGRSDLPINVGRVAPVSGELQGGSGGTPETSRLPKQARPSRQDLPGAGEDARTLLARVLANRGQVPIFQSDELVIDHLVRPIYPDEARDKGIEGRVSVLARIDTAGVVVEANVLNPSGETQLDDAARHAVRQCRFRPYVAGGQRQEVYAVFRFRFRLTEP
jgi:TonB family protein